MTPDPLPRPPLIARVLPVLGTAALLGLAVVASCVGCNKPYKPISNSRDAEKAGKSEKPWEDAAAALRADSSLASCRTVLVGLNADLAGRTDAVPVPAGLTPQAEAQLRALLPLAPADLEEIRPAGFTPLDPAYLADCLYLQDAARSLEVAGLPDARRAEQAFEWVCRQAYSRVWPIDIGQGQRTIPALPPTAVLRRGYGSGLERAYVFLALLQQLGLDGCLVGRPDSERHPAVIAYPAASRPVESAVFWAVGVRVGPDILLFDPWRGQPFPGPGGKGIGTLAQVRTSPDQLREWLDTKTSGVTPDDLKKGTVYLTLPVSALAPRMVVIEQQLRSEVGVNLAVDPVALRNRFLGEAVKGPAFPNPDVKFWYPPGDRFAYGRVLASFLPVNEGGAAKNDPLDLYPQYQQSLAPGAAFEATTELIPPLREQLVKRAQNTFWAAFFTPPTPRELIQRGQFQEASRAAEAKRAAFAAGRERLKGVEQQAGIQAFCAEANRRWAKVQQAGLNDPDQRGAAQAEYDQLLQEQSAVYQLLLDRATAPAGLAEAAYLFALNRHELAERAQQRAERAAGGADAAARQKAQDAWREAVSAWRGYLDERSGHAAFPGQAAHALVLANRASSKLQGR